MRRREIMADLRYQRTVIGYHGCDEAVAADVLAGRMGLKLSTNLYDWLGGGIYFWEHGPQRACEWATEHARLSGTKIETPSVLGAKINLRDLFGFVGYSQHRAFAAVVNRIQALLSAERHQDAA